MPLVCGGRCTFDKLLFSSIPHILSLPLSEHIITIQNNNIADDDKMAAQPVPKPSVTQHPRIISEGHLLSLVSLLIEL